MYLKYRISLTNPILNQGGRHIQTYNNRMIATPFMWTENPLKAKSFIVAA